MADSLHSFVQVFSALFPVINPPGMALFFLALTRKAGRDRRTALARRIAFYSLLVIGVSYSIGKFILIFMGISIPVMQVAGGMVLVAAGWKFLNETRAQDDTDVDVGGGSENLESIAFYPLTMPITTGPGTISVAIALGTTLPERIPVLLGALSAAVAIAAIIYFCYRFADRIEGALGQTGSEALSRLFAFILICIGVQILWSGVSQLWLSLPPK